MSGSSIKDFIKKLKGCHEERIRQLANTIGTIWSTTGESSNISVKLTQQIRDLKNIPSNTDDIDTGPLNELIVLLKQTVQNNELTKSYKNLRDSIEKYAEKIECPPEQEDEPIDKAIKYLIEFAKTRKDSEMIIDNIILIYTIISKIYYNTLYHPNQGKKVNRNDKQQYIALGSGGGSLFSNIDNDEISEYVKNTLKAMSDSHFIQGFFNNNELKSYSYTDTGTYPIISYKTSKKMINTEIEEFIKQIEIVFDYLKNVEKKEYDAYVEKKGKKGTKAKEFFDKILLIDTKYRLGTLFKTGWRKGFGEFHDIVRGRLFPTEKALNRSSRMSRRAPQPKGIKQHRRRRQSRVTQPPKMTRKTIKGGPPLHSPPRVTSGYAKPQPGISIIKVEDLKRNEAQRLKREKAKGRRTPGWNSSNSREDFTKYYRDGDRQRSNMKPTYGPRGGNKTRKKKRKKRNTTRNKKRHKKKKHKTRYKKRKKKKRTRKNK